MVLTKNTIMSYMLSKIITDHEFNKLHADTDHADYSSVNKHLTADIDKCDYFLYTSVDCRLTTPVLRLFSLSLRLSLGSFPLCRWFGRLLSRARDAAVVEREGDSCSGMTSQSLSPSPFRGASRSSMGFGIMARARLTLLWRELIAS